MLYQLGVLLLFPIVMSFAAITDALSFKISNWASLLLVLGFFVIAPFSGLTLAEIGIHIGVAFAVLIFGFILFARGWLGGGDVKIISAAVLWLGPTLIAPFLLILAFVGGLLSLICLYVRDTPLPSWLAGQRWLLNWQCGEAAVPYGIAIGVAALMVYPESVWLGLS